MPFGDTDAAGVVFYANYYRWFDRMSHELFRSLGVPLNDFMELDQAPVLAETGCRFAAPARYDDMLTLSATPTDLGARSIRIEHTVARNADVIASGFEVRIWVEVKNGGLRAMSLPAVIREALSGDRRAAQGECHS